MNEVPFLAVWPSWKDRMHRLIEVIAIMRLLWKSSSYVNFDGEYFKIRQVCLYTKPKTDLKIYFSSAGPKAAYYTWKYGDHLITLTLHKTLEQCRDELFPSFERGGRDAGKNPRKMEKIVSLNFTWPSSESDQNICKESITSFQLILPSDFVQLELESFPYVQYP